MLLNLIYDSSRNNMIRSREMCSDVIIQKIDDTILYCKCVDCNGSCKYIENCIIKYIANLY